MKKKIFSTLLAMILSCSVMVGCAKGTGSTDSSTGGQTEEEVVNTAIPGTIHQFIMTETENYMVKDGLTDYVVLMPNEYDEYLRKAKDEFVYFFKQATDIDIGVVYEDETGKTHNANNKYISLGQTKLLQSADLNIDYDELGSEGCRIKTKDKTVYIVGGSSLGTLYTVYDFFQLVFNYETYYHNTFKIDKNVKNVKLNDFDVIDVPDIPARISRWGCVVNTESKYRFRYGLGFNDYALPVAGPFDTGYRIHNMSELVWDDGEYEAEWLAKNGGNQLCFTARGDEELYNALIDHIVNKLIQNSFTRFTPKDYPMANYIAITIEDTGGVCNCDACGRAYEKHGAYSGQVIVFANDIMEKVKDWMSKPENAEYRRDDLKLMFFAYEAFLDAPAVYNEETGKYEYASEECVMRDDVVAWYCVNNGFGYMKDFSAPASDVGKERARKWFDLSDNVALWTYPIDYSTNMVLTDTYNFFTDEYWRFVVEGGTTFYFQEGAGSMSDTTGFEGLKAFLDYKLMWNASLNSYDLTREWFEGMYADAAPMMYQLFLEQREHNVEFFYTIKRLNGVPTWVPHDNMDDWDTTTLFNWMNTCEEAIELIEKKYKTHYPEEYERIKYNIELEYVMHSYMLFKVFGAQIQGVEREVLLTKLKDVLSNKMQISSVNKYVAGLTV